jgi:hypothetical protein
MNNENIYEFGPTGHDFSFPNHPIRIVGCRGKSGRRDWLYGLADECQCGETLTLWPTLEEGYLLAAGIGHTQRRTKSLIQRGRLDFLERLAEVETMYDVRDVLDGGQAYYFEHLRERHRKDWTNPKT